MQDVGVQIERSTGAPSATPAIPFDESDFDDPAFADLAVTGSEVSGEYRCTDCGYGAVVHRALPQCPMCGGTVWERRGALARGV